MRVKPIGTGPFKLDSFKQFDSVRLLRNPDYFKAGRPYLDGIEFHIVASPSTALLSFVAGRFDMTFPWSVTAPQLRDVRRQAPRVACETTSMNSSTNVLMNPRRAALRQSRHPTRAVPGAGPPGLHRCAERRHRPDRRHPAAARRRPVGPAAGQAGGHTGLWARRREEPRGGPHPHARRRLRSRQAPCARRSRPAARRSTATPRRCWSSSCAPSMSTPELEVIEASQWFPRLARKDYALGITVTGNGVDDPDQSFFEHFSCRSERNYNGYCNGEIERLFESQSGRDRSRQAPAHCPGRRRQAAGRRRAAGHHVEPQHHLLAALRQGLRRPRQQHVQQLPLRGRLARPLSVPRSGDAQASSHDSCHPERSEGPLRQQWRSLAALGMMVWTAPTRHRCATLVLGKQPPERKGTVHGAGYHDWARYRQERV